jgi:hypothetical protein
MTNDPKPNPLNPMAMPIPDAARLLGAVGGQPVAEATIRSDVESGAPTNADGTLNLVHYAAWLVKEIGRGD